MKNFLSRCTGLFFVLFMVFIPFVYRPVQQGITEFIFGTIVHTLGNALYKKSLVLIDFSSDTRSLLVLMGLLLVLAVISVIVLRKHHQKLLPYLKTATVYFLALVLLKYGFDKIALRQFYTPAPNILYTPLGNLDPDILFWSTMGTSPAYQIILGSIEVLAAMLLLFIRTRFVGLLLAIITLMQVVVINFTFDISVKMFSLLLLAMALYASWAQLKTLFVFLLTQKPTLLPKQETIAMPVYIKAGVKCFLIGLMFLVSVNPLIEPKRQKPALYGAYKVIKYEKDGKSVALHNAPVKRVFVHPNYYMIFQAQDDSMTDYYFTSQSNGNQIELLGYNGRQKLTYSLKNGTLTLYFANGTALTATAVPWQKMPALHPKFHFMIDSME